MWTAMSRRLAPSGAVLALLLCGAGMAPALDFIRSPMGVYAHLDIDAAINRYPGSSKPTEAELHIYLRKLYASLLSNRAISGIAAGQHWDKIQLTNNGSSGYDWSYLDDVFAEARATRKSVQLSITPGFDIPSWVLAEIPSCDGLFAAAATAPADCGAVTFANFPEQQHSDGNVLPLPWNGVYQTAWQAFLTALN